jgi:aminoglycoside phosphotransferase family enzyme/predicted kinase
MPNHEPAPLDWQDRATLRRVRAAIGARPFRKEGAGGIQMVQTHISTVFLTGRLVFKFKRPRDVGFADFRTLRSRLHFCREELRLNRRLARDVYLDVVALREAPDGTLTFRKRGRIVDHAVLMRRLPRSQMLDARLRARHIPASELDPVAATVARFHRRLRPSRTAALFGGIETWRKNWEENFSQTLPEVGETIPAALHGALHERVSAFLEEHRKAIEARVTEGFVRNGHGDLRCEHIQVDGPVRIIDCIEFNERFRIADVANDLAFLLMDLCAFHRPDLATRVLERYRQLTQDPGLRPLIPFYACYRAFVRGKVLGMRLRDRNLSPEARAATRTRARGFFALADAFGRQMGAPAVILVCGLMGTGKSTLAASLAVRTGAAVISSDRTRKELAGVLGQPGDRSPFGAGLYTEAWTQRTYAVLFQRARELLAQHTSVILDGTFSRSTFRQQALSLAQESGAGFFVVECIAPDSVTLARLTTRARVGTGISDGRAELYRAHKAAFEPITEVPAELHGVVRTDGMMEDAIRSIVAMPSLKIPDPLFTLPASDRPWPSTDRSGKP